MLSEHPPRHRAVTLHDPATVSKRSYTRSQPAAAGYETEVQREAIVGIIAVLAE